MKKINQKFLMFFFVFILLIESSGAVVSQVGNTIYIYGIGNNDVSDIVVTISNTSCISGNNPIYSTCNIYQNDTLANLFLNNTELRLNDSVIWVNHSFEINDAQIMGWNSTNNIYSFQNDSNMSQPRASLRIGKEADSSNSIKFSATNSTIAYLGYNSSDFVNGVTISNWKIGVLNNVSIHDLYRMYLYRYNSNTMIVNSSIYNNSYNALELWANNVGITISNTKIYNNNWNYKFNEIYGGGGIRLIYSTSVNNTFNNLTMYNNWGSNVLMSSGSNNSFINSNIYSFAGTTHARGIEYNGASESIIENNTIIGNSACEIGIYDVKLNTNIFRNNTVNNCTYGEVNYQHTESSDNDYNNILMNNSYQIYFRNSNKYSTLRNISFNAGIIGEIFSDFISTKNSLFDPITNISQIRWYARGNPSLYINYTNHKMVTVQDNYENYHFSSMCSSQYCSIYSNKTGTDTNNTIIFNLTNLEITPFENSTLINYDKNNNRLTLDYQNYNIQFLNITFNNISLINITLNNISTSNIYSLKYKSNDTQIASSTGNIIYFNSSLYSDDYYIVETIISTINITSFENNKTNNASKDIILNSSESIKFNATANQIITTWTWAVNGSDKSINFDNYTTTFNTTGLKNVSINATNANGTSNTIYWNITVISLPVDSTSTSSNNGAAGGSSTSTGESWIIKPLLKKAVINLSNSLSIPPIIIDNIKTINIDKNNIIYTIIFGNNSFITIPNIENNSRFSFTTNGNIYSINIFRSDLTYILITSLIILFLSVNSLLRKL